MSSSRSAHSSARYTGRKLSSKQPPSMSYGEFGQASLELDAPVTQLGPTEQYCTSTGETEVDTSVFKGRPYTIGFALKHDNQLVDWNQDGPGNYYRPKSLIRIQPRLVVDRTCYVKFALLLPRSICPGPGESRREFEVEVRAYALDDPDLCTRATARFMVMNGNGIGGGRRMSRS
ncbi:hypothetical protein FRB90_002386 [Tulasnella sp. 427]|nr:hypothetical protein FRB90_002386 [Tulasnella sp. 427]